MMLRVLHAEEEEGGCSTSASAPAADPALRYASVLDGHGGTRCVTFIASALPATLAADPSISAAALSACDAPATLLGAALHRAFVATDRSFLDGIRETGRNDGATALCVLLREATLSIANVGDTRAVLGRRRLTEGRGGSSMRERGLEAVRLSLDHKPNLPEEAARVRANGGDVKQVRGVWRVGVFGGRGKEPSPSKASPPQGFVPSAEFAGARPGLVFKLGDGGVGYYPDPPAARPPGKGSPGKGRASPTKTKGSPGKTSKTSLAISRAFGNLELKEQAAAGPLVCSEPHVASLSLDPATDRLIILATDGLWDVLSDAEAVRIASEAGRRVIAQRHPPAEGGEGGGDTPPPSQEVPPAASQPAAEAAAEALLLAASQAQGWCDNTSVLVLWIGW